MSDQRIYLSDEAVEHSLAECAADPVFQKAFSRTLDLFATQVAAHQGSTVLDDVSAKDVEAQLFREFYKITILSRLEKLANGEFGRRMLIKAEDR